MTTCVTRFDVLAAKLVSPPYCAVTATDQMFSEEILRVATPLAFSVPAPMDVPLPRNVTAPVAVPAAGFLTVAVKVTDCPTVEGFGEETRAVTVRSPNAK